MFQVNGGKSNSRKRGGEGGNSKKMSGGGGGVWEPPQWKQVLDNLQTMRAARDAPVDSMGADQCMDQGAEPKVTRRG